MQKEALFFCVPPDGVQYAQSKYCFCSKHIWNRQISCIIIYLSVKKVIGGISDDISKRSCIKKSF